MGIMLGDLTVEQIEQRLGIALSDEEREFMRKTRQLVAANVKEGKWHCFDMPFMIVAGGMDFAGKLNEMLMPYADQMKCQIQIGVE